MRSRLRRNVGSFTISNARVQIQTDIIKTARKLYTRRNEHRKWQCKSAVSEHVKDAGYSIDWASVKLIGQENHLLSHKIREPINIHSRRPKMNCDQGYNLPPCHFMEQFCSLIKTRLRLKANVITDKGIRKSFESSAKLSNKLLVLKNIFCNYLYYYIQLENFTFFDG